MIDRSVIERDARANIADWPVTIRFHGRTLTVHLSSTSDVSDVLTGALLDDMQITLVCMVSDFGGDLPDLRDLLEVQLRDGKWKQFEVQRRPDFYDPLQPFLQLNLGSPEK